MGQFSEDSESLFLGICNRERYLVGFPFTEDERLLIFQGKFRRSPGLNPVNRCAIAALVCIRGRT